ncbi:hypothetical protein Tco_0781698 [Tanacetum coccineum]
MAQVLLKKFDMESVRPATTPFEASKPKSKDEPDDVVNVHLYRSMIGSLMYLTASRPDIQFAVSACSRHQVTPLTSNLNAVKEIALTYSDSDYAGSHGDRKSTTGGCQFLGRRLISWQCKKQTIVATSPLKQNMLLLLAVVVSASEEAPPKLLLATIVRISHLTITESLVRSQLQLDDDGGVEDLPIADIYLGMDNLGYPSEGKLTFFKNKFSPQWRDKMQLFGYILPPAQADIAGESSGEAGTYNLDWVLPGLPLRPQHCIFFKPNELLLDNFTSTNVEDETMGHKLLFKEVVEKLVQKVKLLEDKLKGRKRKFVMTDSDKEEDAEQDVDHFIKLAKAAATAAAASAVPTGGSHKADIPPSSYIPSDEFAVSHAIKELTADSFSPDVNEDNFAETNVSLIAMRERVYRDPEAEHKMCIKYASNVDSASDDDTPVNFFAVVDWELLPTGLGLINVFYRKDNSRKCFTSLREILHLVTRADLMTIYGRVMTFYQDKQAMGVGLVLWGDLKVLMDSPKVNDGSDVWKNQHTWSIQSWKLYSYSGVHVLETVGGLVVHMFVDKKYPLSVNLIERMLDHQLEICHDTVGNELTTAVQLIAFLKKQISDSRRPKAIRLESIEVAFGVGFNMLLFNPMAFTKKDLSRNLKYVVPTGRVKVPAGRYVVPTGKENVIVSPDRTKFILAGRTILVLVVLFLLVEQY